MTAEFSTIWNKIRMQTSSFFSDIEYDKKFLRPLNQLIDFHTESLIQLEDLPKDIE